MKQSFSEEFLEVYNSIPFEFLKIEGLSKDELDIPLRKKSYDNNLKIAGEENANVGNKKNASHRSATLYEPWDKLLGYEKLYLKMNEFLDKDNSNNLLSEMLRGGILLHDSTGIDSPYCIAVSSYFLMRNGRDYVTTPNIEPGNFNSYMNTAVEMVMDLSKNFKGATVIFDLLIGMAYYTKHHRDTKLDIVKHNLKKLQPNRELTNVYISTQMETLATELVSIRRSYDDSLKLLQNLFKDDIISATNYVIDYKITNSFQSMVHLVNNQYRAGNQSPFTNLSIYSPRVLKDHFDFYEYPNGLGIDEYLDEILQIQLLFAKFFSNGIKGKDLKKVVSFPVVTINVPADEIGAEELIDKDKAWCKQIYLLFSKYNNLNVYRGLKLAICCRLLVEKAITDTVNSLGVVTNHKSYLATGSLRVTTLDFAHIAFKALLAEPNSLEKRIAKFNELLYEYLHMCVDILKVQRELIFENDKKGFFDLSLKQGIDYKALASSIGGLGLYEGCKIIYQGTHGETYSNDEILFGKNVLKICDEFASVASKEVGFTIGLEISVPGESGAIRLRNRNVHNFGIENIPYKELSNQFLPNTIDVEPHEKLRIESIFVEETPSTTITHFNIEEDLTPEGNYKLHMKIQEDYKIPHYALNSILYSCENGHLNKTTKYDGTCIECSGKILSKSSRSIGYFRDVDNEFGSGRRDEFYRRKYFEV